MMVDSDVIIWHMRGNLKARDLLDTNTGFYLSAVTYMEVVQGLRNKKELKAFKEALQFWQTKILQIDERISTKAMLYVEQYFLSHSLQLADALIGATAISYQLRLVTGNSKHYSVFRGLEISNFSPL